MGELERGEARHHDRAAFVAFGAAALLWQLRYLSVTDTIDGMRIGLDETSGSVHSPTTLLGAAVTGMGILALLAVIVFVGVPCGAAPAPGAS